MKADGSVTSSKETTGLIIYQVPAEATIYSFERGGYVVMSNNNAEA